MSSVHQVFDTRIFHREAMSLVRKGFGVTLIISCSTGENFVDGVKIVPFPKPKSRFWRIAGLWRILKAAIGERADIYHFHDPELIPYGLLLHFLMRKPVIYDVHEHYPDAIRIKQWLPRVVRSPLAFIFDLFEVTVARYFDAIITADDSTAQRFESVNSSIIILYNYPRQDFCENEPSGKPDLKEPVRLAYVGSISPERGQWLMLDIVRTLVKEKKIDTRLQLAGPFDSEDELRNFFEVVDADATLRGRVTWSGVLAQHALPTWLKSAHIGLVPLIGVDKFLKNIPTKIFEYMAAALPIVGSDLPPIRKFIEDAKAGFLAGQGDPNSYAEKVILLLRNPEQAARMGRKGRIAFESKYNWRTEEAKLVGLYEQLLNKSKKY